MTETWADGRIALVTGATSGFGEAFARRVLAAGGRVIATGRRADRLQGLADELKTERLLTRVLDVREQASIDALMSALPADFQAIDILYNNAGLALGLAKAPETRLEDWETMIETNVMGLARVTRAVLPGMVARDRGDVVNIASVAATYPYPGGNVYGATKAFARQFSLNLRADLIGTPVRVSVIEPGMCGGTEFSNVRLRGNDAAAAKVYEGTTPLTAADIAETAYWIATLPPHVNINIHEMMPTCQGFSAFTVKRVQ
jgi:NADP-dependent 3-hydroxy acid dehydrogenase YdfG